MPGDRTEQATPHRRDKARSQGDIVYSRDLSASAGVLAGVVCLGQLGQKLIENFRLVFTAGLSLSSVEHWEPSTVQSTLSDLRRILLVSTLPACAAVAAIPLASVLAGFLQTGGLQISGTALGFHFDRVNPTSNIKNLFSLRAASRLGKSLLPEAILAVVAAQRIA